MKEMEPKQVKIMPVNGIPYRLIDACAWCPKKTWPELKEREMYTSIICPDHYEKEWHKYVVAHHLRKERRKHEGKIGNPTI